MLGPQPSPSSGRSRRHWLHALALGPLLVRPGLLHAQAAPHEAPPAAPGRVLRVGPGRDIRSIAQAARAARDGDTVEVDAGRYTGDVAVWTKDRLHLRAVGGRVQLLAAGAAAERKGTWVVRGGTVTAEGFDFHGARVPHHNGAGIRLERGNLTVRDCIFTHNQVGLQTNNDPRTELTVEHCEFAYNLRPDGHNHQLYAGNIGRLTVVGSYFHHGHVGHLLKSRAAVSHVFYNRLTDEAQGRASYELEFPNGGVAVVVGNVIEQSALTENVHLVAYGAEGYRWPANELHLSHNTLVDNRVRSGVFLRVRPGADRITAVNNLLLGTDRLERAAAGDYRNNFHASRDDFVDAATHDFRLKPAAPAWGKAVDSGMAGSQPLTPTHEYVHPRGLRQLDVGAAHPGAVQSAKHEADLQPAPSMPTTPRTSSGSAPPWAPA